MPYDVRPVTEKRFRDVERLAQTSRRNLALFRRRPEEPRGVRYTPAPASGAPGIVVWEEPRELRNVTHYHIYAPDELTLIMRVPEGQLSYQPVTGQRALVSSFNASSKLESRKVPAEGPVPWVP